MTFRPLCDVKVPTLRKKMSLKPPVYIRISSAYVKSYLDLPNMSSVKRVVTGVIQKVLPVLSTKTLLHIWLSTEYYGFRPSSTAVDTGDTWELMMSK